MSYLIDARRTAIGTTGGIWRTLDTTALAAPVLNVLASSCPDLSQLTQVILGNVRGPGGNPARLAALAAGLGQVPALTIDRQCGSGLAAIEVAHHWLASSGGYLLAGGVQAASTEPLTFWPAPGDEPPRQFTRAPFAPVGYPDPEMGEAADLLAAEHGISRERQDGYALRSHQRALASQAGGVFGQEIVAIAGLTSDERPRRFTAERLARFRPAFRAGGTVTAANSCGVNDGAAAVLLTDAASYAANPVPALKVLAVTSATCDPARPGWGIVPAVQAVLAQTGLSIDQMDVIEFNEAFAAQVLACLDGLGIPENRCCPQGGAIALGHPWAASGAVLAVRLFTQLVRQDAGRYGLAAIAIGGGQGTAMIVERAG